MEGTPIVIRLSDSHRTIVMKPERQLETDLVVQFTASLHAQFLARHDAGEAGVTCVGTALGGQDRALADYLLAANARFALIEFKANEKAIATEAGKPLRHLLCKALQGNRRLNALARDSHYMAWEVIASRVLPQLGLQPVREIMVARYADRVCPLFDEAFPVVAMPVQASERFIRRYLSHRTAGASAKRFKAYLELLYTVAAGCPASELRRLEGSVYVFVPGSAKSAASFLRVPFVGLDHLLALTLGYKLEQTPEQRNERTPPGMERGFSR